MKHESRYEIKFVLNEANLLSYLQWSNQDTLIYKKFPKRVINSLYFDDIHFNSVKDNLSGISERHKIRLRWYGNKLNFNKDPVIEKKIKKGRLGSKKILPLRSHNENIYNKDIKSVSEIVNKRLLDSSISVDSILSPTLIVCYEREYFEDNNNFRITLDKNIKFSLPINSNRLDQHSWISYNKKILELKFEQNNKNYASRIIRNLNLVPTRHSKYLVGLAMNGLISYV